MKKSIEQLRIERIDILENFSHAKTDFLKNQMTKKLKQINIQLYKETQNPIYL